MVKPLPRHFPVHFANELKLQRLTGVETALPCSTNLQKKQITDEHVFLGDLAGKWGSAIIKVCYVLGVVKNLVASKSVGVRDIAASSDSKVSGESVGKNMSRLMQESIAEQRMVVIAQ